MEKHGKDNKINYEDIKVVPLNSEKFITFQIGNLRFLDSYQFLSTSLEELVSLLLKSGKENFVETIKYLGDHDLVFAKGVRLHDRQIQIRRDSTASHRPFL